MSRSLIVLVGLIYLIIGSNYFLKGNIGMGLVFISYAVANAGLYIVG
jgi:hypothetical protein